MLEGRVEGLNLEIQNAYSSTRHGQKIVARQEKTIEKLAMRNAELKKLANYGWFKRLLLHLLNKTN